MGELTVLDESVGLDVIFVVVVPETKMDVVGRVVVLIVLKPDGGTDPVG